jgi:hypothetical protein
MDAMGIGSALGKTFDYIYASHEKGLTVMDGEQDFNEHGEIINILHEIWLFKGT